MRTKPNQAGFTLVELMLAMALFSIIMVISTTGFIGINRTYTRGALRKQLLEAVQRVNSDITSTVSNSQSGEIQKCSPADGLADGCIGGKYMLCFSSGPRYYWSDPQLDQGGLFRDLKECQDPLDPALATELVDARFVVEQFDITPVDMSSVTVTGPNSQLHKLFNARGIIRTSEIAAFTASSNNEDVDRSLPGFKASNIKCKGSAAGSIVQSCAIESFNVVLNDRGGI